MDGSGDAATDGAVAAWAAGRDLPFDLALVRSPTGLTRQRNVGVDASRGEFVYFLDDDCLPEPGYFSAIRHVFEEDRAKAVGGVCGSLVNEMGRPLALRWRWRMRLGLVPGDATPGAYYPTATSVPRSLVAPFSGVRPVDVVPGGAVAWRREVFAVHRFSLFFDGYAQGEDVEMSRRVARSWRLAWCGDAHVHHFHAPSSRPVLVCEGKNGSPQPVLHPRAPLFRRRMAGPRAILAGHRLRLRLGLVYLVARRPPGGHLAHAAGVAAGAGSCLWDPPRHEEPEARTEYEVAWTSQPASEDSRRGAP